MNGSAKALPSAPAAREQIALGHGLAEVGVGHLGHRLGRVVDARGAGTRAGQARRVVRVLGDVAGHAPLALAAEAAHAPGRIRREPDAGLLAVVAHVDTGLDLLAHDVRNRGLRFAREGAAIDRFSPVLPHEQVA